MGRGVCLRQAVLGGAGTTLSLMSLMFRGFVVVALLLLIISRRIRMRLGLRIVLALRPRRTHRCRKWVYKVVVVAAAAAAADFRLLFVFLGVAELGSSIPYQATRALRVIYQLTRCRVPLRLLALLRARWCTDETGLIIETRLIIATDFGRWLAGLGLWWLLCLLLSWYERLCLSLRLLCICLFDSIQRRVFFASPPARRFLQTLRRRADVGFLRLFRIILLR
mmetsp:Transcript_18239/g.54798  ORF Transcript_18239/g.54798 Transcript_18239/m.54798 type:complete len:223 (-) Transcript_18239:449-1117(-)